MADMADYLFLGKLKLTSRWRCFSTDVEHFNLRILLKDINAKTFFPTLGNLSLQISPTFTPRTVNR